MRQMVLQLAPCHSFITATAAVGANERTHSRKLAGAKVVTIAVEMTLDGIAGVARSCREGVHL